jgi:hypothetical protein
MNESILQRVGVYLREHLSKALRYLSGSLLLISGACYVSTFTNAWLHKSDRTINCIVVLMVVCGFFTIWHQWSVSSEDEHSRWHGQDGSFYMFYPHWFRWVWPCCILFVLLHWIWFYSVVPVGYFFIRDGQWTNRHASDFAGLLNEAEYSRLRSGEVRSFAVFMLVMSFAIASYWYFGNGLKRAKENTKRVNQN